MPLLSSQIRLQLETLLAEKARLAHENSVYARENRFLREVVEYHQLTMQDVVYLDEGTEEVTEVYPIKVLSTPYRFCVSDIMPECLPSSTAFWDCNWPKFCILHRSSLVIPRHHPRSEGAPKVLDNKFFHACYGRKWLKRLDYSNMSVWMPIPSRILMKCLNC